MDSNFIELSFENYTVKSLVDTGASLSCISQFLLNKLKHLCYSIEQPEYFKVYGVGGEVLDITGCVTLEFQIAQRKFVQKFHVFKRLHHSLILGVDFLQANGCILGYGKLTVTVEGHPFVNLCSNFPSSFNIGLARASVDVQIQPYHQACIPVRLSRIPNRSTALLEPVVIMSTKHALAGAKMVITSNNGRANCIFLNPMPFPVQIKASQVVGKLFPVENVQDLNDTDGNVNVSVNSVDPANLQTEQDFIEIANTLGINVDKA